MCSRWPQRKSWSELAFIDEEGAYDKPIEQVKEWAMSYGAKEGADILACWIRQKNRHALQWKEKLCFDCLPKNTP